MPPIGIPEAIEVFAQGFSFTKSFTHPYVVVRVGGLTVMKDGPRRRGPYRLEEILAHGICPQEVAATIRDYAPERHMLCAIEGRDSDHDGIKAEYKRLGYRHLRREPLFAKALADAIDRPDQDQYFRVRNVDEANEVRMAAGGAQAFPEHLAEDDAPLRLYAARVDGKTVGWVRSIRVGRCAWVSNMFVVEAHRRRGIGANLMRAMLWDDRRLGVEVSVLLASNLGSKLYPSVGYEQIGLLQSFMLRKAGPPAEAP